MSALFSVLSSHLDAPRPAAALGQVVLSSLPPGSTAIGANTPSVKLVLEGEEIYRVDGRTVRLRPGQFLYLEPGAACEGMNRSDTVGLCLALPVDRAPEGSEVLFGRAVTLSTRTSGLGRRLDLHARQIARDPSLGPRLAGSIVREVALALGEPLSESREAMARLRTARPSTRRDLHQRLELARGHLHEHGGRAVTLAELAGVAGLSQFHLARYFKAAFGAAPVTYHRALRLERAARLVAQGASLAEAAEAVGYSDATALSHAFRRHHGCAPLSWVMNQPEAFQ